MIKGFIIGKFMPFHKGHEALIEYAKNKCDELTILVGAREGEPISLKYRLSWVTQTYLHDPNIVVKGDNINHPDDLSYDDLSVWWGNHILENFGQFDRVFSSEDYGDFFAKAMGAENCIFNIDRTIVPISATMIREKPHTHWDMLNNFAKDYFVKKICIVGTESTGKTTLADQLAFQYRTVWCPELGRELVPDTRECTIEDLKNVGKEHAKHILKYTRTANKVLFVDTDLNITKSYSNYLFAEIPEYPEWVENANKMDLTIFLKPNAPYVNDGTRLPKEERDLLHISHLEIMAMSKGGAHMIDYKGNYEERFHEITKIIDDYIKDL